MERLIYLFYLASLSLTSAFAITSTITIPLSISLFSILTFFLNNYSNQARIIVIELEDIFIAIFLLLIYLSFFLNFNNFTSIKPFNHLVAYTYIILAGYYLMKNIYCFLERTNKNFVQDTYKVLYVGLLITCLFGIIEFVLKNFFHFTIDTFIPRPAVSDYSPLATEFIRSRSFQEESGHLALFIEIFGPIGLHYCKPNKFKWGILFVIITLCMIFTFSTAGWIIVIFTYICLKIAYIDILKWKKSLNISVINIFLYAFLVLTFTYLFYKNFEVVSFVSSVIYDTIFAKIAYSGSAEDRGSRFVEGYEAFLNADVKTMLFGYGPAVYDTLRFSRGGTLVLYLTFVLESGLLGLLSFLCFCAILLFKTIILRNAQLRFALQFGLISSLLHYFLISNYWYPWFWVLAILIQVNYRNLHNRRSFLNQLFENKTFRPNKLAPPL